MERKIIFETSTGVDIEFIEFVNIKKELISDYINELKEQLVANDSIVSWICDMGFSDMNGFLDILRHFIKIKAI